MTTTTFTPTKEDLARNFSVEPLTVKNYKVHYNEDGDACKITATSPKGRIKMVCEVSQYGESWVPAK